jgi:biopolymer transport protein ExbD
MKRLKDEPTKSININIVPLCDVSFTILVTLMVVTAYIQVVPPPFMIDLPQIVSEEERGSKFVMVHISADQRISIQGKEIKFRECFSYLKREAILNPRRLVLIAADRSVPHGVVLNVLDNLKVINFELRRDGKEGFKKVAFAARKKKG